MINLPFHISEVFFTIPLILGGLRGYNRGIILQFISLMSLMLVFYGFTFLIYAFSESFYEWFALDIINTELFLTLFLTIVSILSLHIFMRMIFDKFVSAEQITLYSRLSGFFLGSLRYAFILSIFYAVFNEYSPIEKKTSWFYESRNSSYILKYNSLIAPFIFTYLRFNESRDLEYVKKNTIHFGGQKVKIEPTVNFMCDSTKSVVWKFIPLNEEKPNKDTSLVEAKISYYNEDKNLNNFTFQFLLLKKDSSIFLHKYLENDRSTARNKGFIKLSNAYIQLTNNNE